MADISKFKEPFLKVDFKFNEDLNEDRGFTWKRVNDELKHQLLQIWGENKDFIFETLKCESLGLQTKRLILAVDLKSAKIRHIFRFYANYSDDFGEGYLECLLRINDFRIIVIKAVVVENKIIVEFINAECRKPLLVIEISIVDGVEQ